MGPGSQLTSALNQNKLQVSKIAKNTHKDREGNAIDITTRNYYAIREV